MAAKPKRHTKQDEPPPGLLPDGKLNIVTDDYDDALIEDPKNEDTSKEDK